MSELRKRIAETLGWAMKDTKGFSFPHLRELVRDKDPELAEELAQVIERGEHIYMAEIDDHN